jgi:thiosulfate dehydrogenase (quinone) large subunit
MATIHPEAPSSALPATLVEADLVTSSAGRRVLAAARLATGFIFLWAFLDKTFGLHYSTGAAVAEGDPSLSWINGGTPSQGFMSYAAIGPFKGMINSLSGVGSDWLFMLAMLGVGVAVMLGIGLRVSAVVGAFVMLMMWVAEWPLIQGSTNPLIDYHIIYALVLVLSAVLLAGDTWGLGRVWAKLSIVQRFGWLR